MLTFEQNVMAILETNFTEIKEELLEIACRRICELKGYDKPEWIPFGTSVPNYATMVLATFKTEDGRTKVDRAYYDGEFWWFDFAVEATIVIAWMPLPEPYEPKESEEE